MSTDMILYILALISFALDAFKAPLGISTNIGLVSLGFALLAATLVF